MTRTEETTQESSQRSQTSIAEASESELGVQELLAELAQSLGTQFGDISNITSGDFLELPDEVSQQIQTLFGEQAAQSRRAADRTFQTQQTELGDYFSRRGITDSSIETSGHGALGAQQLRTLQDIESQRVQGITGAELNLPFQIANTQLAGMTGLSGSIQGLTGNLLNALLQARMANRTTTGTSAGTGVSETSGATIGDLTGLGALIP